MKAGTGRLYIDVLKVGREEWWSGRPEMTAVKGLVLDYEVRRKYAILPDMRKPTHKVHSW